MALICARIRSRPASAPRELPAARPTIHHVAASGTWKARLPYVLPTVRSCPVSDLRNSSAWRITAVDVPPAAYEQFDSTGSGGALPVRGPLGQRAQPRRPRPLSAVEPLDICPSAPVHGNTPATDWCGSDQSTVRTARTLAWRARRILLNEEIQARCRLNRAELGI